MRGFVEQQRYLAMQHSNDTSTQYIAIFIVLTHELTQKYGIAAGRLNAQGVSYLCPVAGNDTEAGKAKNRRVELVGR